MSTWTMRNAEQEARLCPDDLTIPEASIRYDLPERSMARVCVVTVGDDARPNRLEACWIEVRAPISAGRYSGIVRTDLFFARELRVGVPVEFGAEHVYAVAGPRP